MADFLVASPWFVLDPGAPVAAWLLQLWSAFSLWRDRLSLNLSVRINTCTCPPSGEELFTNLQMRKYV